METGVEISESKQSKQGSSKQKIFSEPESMHPIEFRSHKNCIFRICFLIVSSALFNILITLLIIFNTYILMTHHYDLTEEEENFTESMDFVFVAIFLAEILLKLVGLGFYGFKMDAYNIFDFFIVLLSFIEIGFQIGNLDTPLLESLRALRALRMLKLSRFNSETRLILKQLFNSVKAIGSFSAVLFLFLFVWTLMGMELFAYKVIIDEATGEIISVN